MIEDDLIKVQVEKEITNLFKSYLEMSEQFQIDHRVMMNKVSEKTSEEFASSVDYLTKEKSDALRSLILGKGNDSMRNILTFLSFFDFQINKERVEQAASQRSYYKKTIISNPVVL